MRLSAEQKRRIARLLMARPLPRSASGTSVRRIPPEIWEGALHRAEAYRDMLEKEGLDV